MKLAVDVIAQTIRTSSEDIGAGALGEEIVNTLSESGYVIVPKEPTEAMLIAARDWSLHKYGKPVGNDGVAGCYNAMLGANE